jgi:hypothetical protein
LPESVLIRIVPVVTPVFALTVVLPAGITNVVLTVTLLKMPVVFVADTAGTSVQVPLVLLYVYVLLLTTAC